MHWLKYEPHNKLKILVSSKDSDQIPTCKSDKYSACGYEHCEKFSLKPLNEYRSAWPRDFRNIFMPNLSEHKIPAARKK